MIRGVLLCVFVLFATAGVAFADSAGDTSKPGDSSLAEDLAKQAKSHTSSTLQGVEVLRQAQIIVSQSGLLAFRKALFTDGAPESFGIYVPRKTNIFRSGDDLHVYLEPIGLHWDREGDIYHSLTTIDYEVQSPDGKILAGQHDFGKMDLHSREQNQEIMYRVNLTLTGAQPGKYVLMLTCHEQATGNSASVKLPFEFQ
jgi:hypothetical protein